MTHTVGSGEHGAVDTVPGLPDTNGKHAPHVLIADDEAAVRHYVARVLQREAFVVHEAADGMEALDILKCRAVPVELVVSDIVMPRLDGVELLRALEESRPDIPVILMSAYAQAELAKMGVIAPCGVLSKPFPAQRLIEEVRRCLSLRR